MNLFKRKKPLKILFVASEAAPFAKAGGLGEVMYSLPRALNRLGHDARVMIPKYLGIDTQKFPMETVLEGLYVPNGDKDPLICNIKMCRQTRTDDSPVTTYFLENQEYYEKRSNIYGYTDDPLRWALLSRGTLEFLRRSKDWTPDVIVASDWQTGLIPNYLHSSYKDDRVLNKIPVVFSIHNLYYQGMFNHRFVSEMDYDSGQGPVPEISDLKLMKINFMRRGIMYADIINTVSENYAKEITTPEYGELLDDLLRERRSRLFGILNGIDYTSRNSETDPYLEVNFGLNSIDQRIKNKLALQNQVNLPKDENAFIFGIISRLTEQKGIDLFVDAADAFLRNFKAQFVILGTGDSKYMDFLKGLKEKYPHVIVEHFNYEEAFSHQLLAGCDAVLIPSKFEPCGLVQMEAMRYGAIPIVRATGGLAESVIDYNPQKDSGTGFVFSRFDHYALLGTMIRAVEAYKYKISWMALQRRAMSVDFSWDASAQKYEKLFERAIGSHAAAKKPSH